jgi:hypothetical protein
MHYRGERGVYIYNKAGSEDFNRSMVGRIPMEMNTTKQKIVFR